MSIGAWEWLKSKYSRGQSSVPPDHPCYWQTDIHSHLLPGLDDGVKTHEDSLMCIQQLVDWGITKIITTPHVSRDVFPNEAATILKQRDILQDQIEQANISVQIDVAAEYMLDDFFLSILAKGNLLSFGTERYLLIEMGWASPPRDLEQIIFQLLIDGYTPILAHPERYSYYLDNAEILQRLRELGCLFQLNWLSLTGQYGSRVSNQAQRLLKNNWVDFIGSDLHRPADLQKLGQLFTMPIYNSIANQPLRNSQL
ncbi:tyrosine-protein phosphatase [Spirosoma sp. KNUC1025]|uniref:tyrosine-protein phosphatase n=1 Tax=Spirosoma sp. KNUC1025 TaxID=2894082 RepID=UPI00386520F7|nr:histidinol-phosphatase [Spirosoma sp. KNUC1025]